MIVYVSCLTVLAPDVVESLVKNRISSNDLIDNSIISFSEDEHSIDLHYLKNYLKYCFYSVEEYKADDEAKSFFNNTRRERRYSSNPLIGLLDIINNFSYVN